MSFDIHINNTVKDSKKEMLFSELHSLLSSGLDFSNAFRVMLDCESDSYVKLVMNSILEDVIKGCSLYDAFHKSAKFNALDCGVLRIGEETGRLKASLQFLTEYYHKKIEQKRMILSAVNYPMIIIFTAIIVVVFMLTFLVPMFEQVYSRMGGELPALTKFVIAVSKELPTYVGLFSLIIISLVIFLIRFKHNIQVRYVTSNIILIVPVIGNVVRKSHCSHFCKLLYMLTISGVPLLYGIGILKTIITFYPYQLSFDTIYDGLQKGESFASGLNQYPKLYDKKLTSLLHIGEETNRLSDMLKKQGEDITKELEYQLKQVGNLLEPLLILLVGVFVAIILISIYLPMFRLGGVLN